MVLSQPAKKGPSDKSASYDHDVYAWSQEQARLLKAGRLNEIDAENIAEEILDVGRNEYDKLGSALRVLLVHMLKWDHQPEKRTRSWENTIAEQRVRIDQQLTENPSLRSRIEEATGRAYRRAKIRASTETDLEVDRFPETCPYDWQEIISRPHRR
jgi:Domain of unknown function DUF29